MGGSKTQQSGIDHREGVPVGLHDIVARFELGGMDEQIQHRAEQKADEGDVPAHASFLKHYCPRQPRIRRFGQGKPFILNTAPCQPRRRSPSSLRSCPKRIGSRRWAGNASESGNSGRLRALGESLRPPEPGRRASSPVQKGGGSKLFWTRVTLGQKNG